MNANHSLLCFWEGEKGFLCLEEVLVDFYEPLALRFCFAFLFKYSRSVSQHKRNNIQHHVSRLFVMREKMVDLDARYYFIDQKS